MLKNANLTPRSVYDMKIVEMATARHAVLLRLDIGHKGLMEYGCMCDLCKTKCCDCYEVVLGSYRG